MGEASAVLPKPATTHICPLSNIAMIGACPITRCFAHLPKGRHSSECYYGLMGTTSEIDLPGLSFAFDISRRRVRRELIVGFAELQRLAILYEWLILVRSEGDKFCSRCALPGDTCINILRCNYRAKLVTDIQALYPFNIPEFKFAGRDLWLLIKNQDNLTRQYGFEQIFNFTNQQLALLHRVTQHR
jgi:hypothetical protein